MGATGRPFGLDFGAIMAVGAARGTDVALLADVLPDVEAAVIDALNGEAEGEDDG